jgi:hypothetical protein
MISTLPVIETQKRRFLPVAFLFFLAPLFGEYLLGNLKLSEIIYLPFIAPLYGAGALIIREVTRRAVCLLLILVFFTTISIWSRRLGWSAMHRLAIAGGGIFTYAWLGILMEPDSGPKAGFDYVGSVFLSLAAIALLAFAARKRHSPEITSPN